MHAIQAESRGVMTTWLDIRDSPTGKLLFRFDPSRLLILIKRPDMAAAVTVDLSVYTSGLTATPEQPDCQRVLPRDAHALHDPE